jgi:hypothetical protein
VDDVVGLDNLGSHEGKAVRKAGRTAGARLVVWPRLARPRSHRARLLNQGFVKLNTHREEPLLEDRRLRQCADSFFSQQTAPTTSKNEGQEIRGFKNELLKPHAYLNI